MISLLMTMAVAMVMWCGVSFWLASGFGRVARAPRTTGDEHALIIMGAAKPRSDTGSANDSEYGASALRSL